jgi:hypothetical protein
LFALLSLSELAVVAVAEKQDGNAEMAVFDAVRSTVTPVTSINAVALRGNAILLVDETVLEGSALAGVHLLSPLPRLSMLLEYTMGEIFSTNIIPEDLQGRSVPGVVSLVGNNDCLFILSVVSLNHGIDETTNNGTRNNIHRKVEKLVLKRRQQGFEGIETIPPFEICRLPTFNIPKLVAEKHGTLWVDVWGDSKRVPVDGRGRPDFSELVEEER